MSVSALAAYRDAAGVEAVVQPRGDERYPIPFRLYTGIGFTPRGRSLLYTRTGDA